MPGLSRYFNKKFFVLVNYSSEDGDKFSLKPEEVIVFGNNDYEDGDCASALGIKVYLVDGYLIRSEKVRGT